MAMIEKLYCSDVRRHQPGASAVYSGRSPRTPANKLVATFGALSGATLVGMSLYAAIRSDLENGVGLWLSGLCAFAWLGRWMLVESVGTLWRQDRVISTGRKGRVVAGALSIIMQTSRDWPAFCREMGKSIQLTRIRELIRRELIMDQSRVDRWIETDVDSVIDDNQTILDLVLAAKIAGRDRDEVLSTLKAHFDHDHHLRTV